MSLIHSEVDSLTADHNDTVALVETVVKKVAILEEELGLKVTKGKKNAQDSKLKTLSSVFNNLVARVDALEKVKEESLGETVNLKKKYDSLEGEMEALRNEFKRVKYNVSYPMMPPFQSHHSCSYPT